MINQIIILNIRRNMINNWCKVSIKDQSTFYNQRYYRLGIKRSVAGWLMIFEKKDNELVADKIERNNFIKGFVK